MLDRKIIPDREYRLTILCCLQHLGPVTVTELFRFVSALNLMNYIDLQLNLIDLEEQQQLTRTPRGSDELITATEAGLYTLNSFSGQIPASRRESIASAAEEWRNRFSTEQQTLAEVFPLEGGRCCVRLRLMERETVLIDLVQELEVPTVTSLRERWRKGSGEIYALVMALLAQGYEGTSPQEELPENAQLQQLQSGDWLLSLSGQTINLLLSLPEKSLAERMAVNWPGAQQTLVDRLTLLLTEHVNSL